MPGRRNPVLEGPVAEMFENLYGYMEEILDHDDGMLLDDLYEYLQDAYDDADADAMNYDSETVEAMFWFVEKRIQHACDRDHLSEHELAALQAMLQAVYRRIWQVQDLKREHLAEQVLHIQV